MAQFCTEACKTLDWALTPERGGSGHHERCEADAARRTTTAFSHAPVSVARATRLLDRWPFIDRAVVTPELLARGMTIEREHGRRWNAFTDVGADSDAVAARIALAHLIESELYYDDDVGLPAMERRLEELRGGAARRSIFRARHDDE